MRRLTQKKKPHGGLEDHHALPPWNRQQPNGSQKPPSYKVPLLSRGSTQQRRLYWSATTSLYSHASTKRAPPLQASASTSSPVTAIPNQADTAQQGLEQDTQLANRQERMRRLSQKRKPHGRLEDHHGLPPWNRQQPNGSQKPPYYKVPLLSRGPTQQRRLYWSATTSPYSHASTRRAPPLQASASTSSPVTAIPNQADTAQQGLEQDTQLANRQERMRRLSQKRKPHGRLEDHHALPPWNMQQPNGSQKPPPYKVSLLSRGPTQQRRLYWSATTSPYSHASTTRAPTLQASASTSSPVTAIPHQADTAQQCLKQDTQLANRQERMRRLTQKKKPHGRLEDHHAWPPRNRQQPNGSQKPPPYKVPLQPRGPTQQRSLNSSATTSPYSHTSTTRAPTLQASVSTSSPVTAIPQQADTAQQCLEQDTQLADRQEGLDMAESSDVEIYRKVIIKNYVALKKYLHPDPIIDCETGFELLTITDRRNIKGKDPIDKNEMILRKVIKKGAKGCTDFKERLRKTWQTDLLELINCAVNGQDTKEIESRLEKTAVLCPEYIKHKGELQGNLIKLYRKRCSSIPLSPLLEEIETPLAGFYVMPDIVAVEQKSLTCHKEERTPIKSLKDLFSTRSRGQQEIYLSADAGFGKTAFSKYLAITWCQAHSQDENYACFNDDQLKPLLDFQFLFLVLLRDCTSVCSIDDMIDQQITKKLPSSATLNEVLRREKCLIILDGLDEWTHPDNICSEVTEKIPHRCVRDNCVILTTTRPWRLGVSNLKTSQINKKVELVQLSAHSTRKLEKNAIRKMTGVHNDKVLESKIQDLNKVIRDRRLEHMQVIPLLLMYIVCLWCNNIPIGNSKHEIYTKIIEFLLSRTSKKHPDVQPSRESSASEIPEYLKGHEFCKKFYNFITSLAELAYQTLFNENRENTLVFDRMVAEKYLKADYMKLSLLSGILSESRSKTLIQEIIKVSFSHKTVQEFFAAIFISSHSDAQKIVVEKCRNVQDILDMLKICEFISRMKADRMCAISNDLMSVINEDKKTRGYRTSTGGYMYNNPLYSIQKMFMSCLQEMPESENIQLCLQDFFIDHHTEHSEQLQRLLKQNKTNIKSLYIDTAVTSISEITDLFSLTDLSHIQKLVYRGNWQEEAEINQILFPSLQSVSLFGGVLTNDEQNLSESMSRCQNLQYLYIENFWFSYKILETIFNFISGQKSMKELTLDRLYCKLDSDTIFKRLNLDLSQHSSLSKLLLQELPLMLQLNISTPSLVNVTLLSICLNESSLLMSRDMLSIERVVLRGIEMSAVSLQNFITVLENLPQSVTVKMEGIDPETEYKRVRKHIYKSQTFRAISNIEGIFGLIFEFETIQHSKE